MTLEFDGSSHELGQIGNAFIVLRNDVELPPGEGMVTISVDSNVERLRIALPNGRRRGDTLVDSRWLDAEGETAGTEGLEASA